MKSQRSKKMVKWEKNSLLKGISKKDFQCLSKYIKFKTYAPNEVISKEGESDQTIYLIISGTVEATKVKREFLTKHMQAGDHFGTLLALGSVKKRTQTFYAQSAVMLAYISKEDLIECDNQCENRLISLLYTNHVNYMESDLVGSAERMLHKLKKHDTLATFTSFIITVFFLFDLILCRLKHEVSLLPTSAWISFALMIGFLITSLVFIKKSHMSYKEFGFTLKNKYWVLRHSLFWTLIFCVGILLLKIILINEVPVFKGQPLFHFNIFQNPNITAVLYLISCPLQEVIVRGTIQSTLQYSLSKKYAPIRAIFLSNFIFAISHLHINVEFALVVFFTGLFWGWMYYKEKSLLGVVISHTIIGFWAIFILNLLGLIALLK